MTEKESNEQLKEALLAQKKEKLQIIQWNVEWLKDIDIKISKHLAHKS